MKEFELEPGEHVVNEARKHWFIFLLEFLPFAIFALIGIFAYEVAASPIYSNLCTVCAATLAPVPRTESFLTVIRLLLGIWLLMIWTGAWLTFTRYFLNLWVVTNMRIVDIHQKGFFRREVSSLLLNRVQDITINTEGLMASILDIGDINVQSAGAVERFCMKGISNPPQMRDLILKYVSEHPLPTAST